MIDPGILIFVFCIYFIVTLNHLIKIDIIYSGFYLFLFIYTIFTQIGYVYFPYLSGLLNSYYGVDLFYKYYQFIFLSFISLYILIVVFNKRNYYTNYVSIEYSPSIHRLHLFYLIVVCWQLYLLTFFIFNYAVIEYDNMRNDMFGIFTFLYKTYNLVSIILFCLLRLKPGLHKVYESNYIKYFFITGVIISILIAFKSGNRHDLFMAFMPMIFIELSIHNKNFLLIKIIKSSFIIILILLGLNYIRDRRAGDDVISDMPLIEKIVYNDYYAPSHILFSAMNYEMVDPLDVLKSNFCNALIQMDYPYLQTKIGNLLISDSSSRKTGFAFYIFTEGYMAFGEYGFIYNGIIVFIGMSLWKRLSRSNNYEFNIFVMSLIVGQFAGIARAQSSYFVKNIYVFFVPAMIMFYFATGLNPFKTWRILKPLPRQ